MDQLPPDSHWAIASQFVAAWASLAIATPPTMVAAPAMPTPARRFLTERNRGVACLGE